MAIICSKCGHDNPSGMSVCAQCAAPLANLCPNCAFENPIGFKFCGNCGANLLTAMIARGSDPETLRRLQGYIPGHLIEKILRVGKQIEGERRTVTVLFSDVVGFTSISERLDPEEVYAIIDASVAAFRDEIYKHEGTLDKFMGDGVMALFGAPVAHEDDPARAIRCALGMQTALRRVNEEMVAQHAMELQIRIGLNLGTVVVGDISSDLKMNYTALGDSVNVAARLQSVAEPGMILASRAVYEQTRALFEFRELGAIRVKGRVEPVEIFEVVGALREPGRVRGIPGITAPMVGREKEFAQVKSVVDDLLSGKSGSAVLISGDPGIGKSRLTAELKSYMLDKAVGVYEGGCFAYGQSAYHVFTNLLSAYFELRADDSPTVVREKIETRVRAVLPPDQALAEVLPYIYQLLSVQNIEKEMVDRIRHLEPAQLRQQTFLAVRDLFLAHARQEPLLLIFEDLHWIDKLSLDLLYFLFNAVEGAPLCLLGTSRPVDNQVAGQVKRVGTTVLGEKFNHVELQPLSMADSVALVDLLLTIADLPDSLRRMIPQRSEGNPFYLEEIIRMLIDRHIIQRAGERWAMAPGTDLSTFEVPRTLEGLIMARVDHLPEATRFTLQCASVIGRDFVEPLLRRIADGNAPRLDGNLQELLDHELLLLRAEEPERQFSFRHILSQQTVYNSLLLRRREHLHHKIAVVMEELYADRLDEYVEQLAFHYGESKDAGRALPYLVRAAARSAARFANEEALQYYHTALDLVNKANASLDQRVQIFSGLGNAQSFVGNYDSALASYRTALELARSAPVTPEQTRRIAEIARHLGRLHERRGDYGEAMRWLEIALNEMNRDASGSRAVERARIYNEIGWVYYRRAQLEEAYQWRMRALQICEGHDYYAEMASAYNGLAALFQHKGDSARASDYAERALTLRETIGDTEGVARSHSNLGGIAGYLGNWDQAIDHLKRSLELKQRIGDAKSLSLSFSNLGLVYVYKGDSSMAREYFSAGLRLAEKLHDPKQTCLALNGLAQAELLDARWSEALQLLSASTQAATEAGAKDELAEAFWIQAEALLGERQTMEAEAAARLALQIAQEIGIRQTEANAYRVLGAIERAARRWREAESDLSRSIGIWGELKNQFEAARAEFELALLYRDLGMELDARSLLQRCHDTFSHFHVEYYLARVEAATDPRAATFPQFERATNEWC